MLHREDLINTGTKCPLQVGEWEPPCYPLRSGKQGNSSHSGPVAQLVEHRTFNAVVAGSSPARLTIYFPSSLYHPAFSLLSTGNVPIRFLGKPGGEMLREFKQFAIGAAAVDLAAGVISHSTALKRHVAAPLSAGLGYSRFTRCDRKVLG